MIARFKVFASYNILQYMCDLIHVLIFVIVSKCQKSPKLTNIVIRAVTKLEIVRAQKNVSKGCPNTPPNSCSVVTGSQV
jgi:hypothetical protein